MVQRMAGQCHPLLQHNTHLLPLLGHCYKEKWHVMYFLPVPCKKGYFAVGKQLLAFNSLPPLQWKQWGSNFALFYNNKSANWSFKPVIGSAHCNIVNVGVGVGGGLLIAVLYPQQTDTCLPSFNSLWIERTMRQCCPLLQHVLHRSRLSVHH